MDTSPLRTLFCPNCGAPLDRGRVDCEYCGAALYVEHAAEVTLPALAQAQKLIPEMQRRIQANAYDGDAYYQLGLACFTLKLYDQAANAFEQAQRFSPGNPRVHYFSGLAILRDAEPEILSIAEYRILQMRKEFEAALSLAPDLAEARAYHLLTDGLLARNREDYRGALKPLNQVVQTLPTLKSAWKILAACYFQVGDYTSAVHASSRAFQLDPNDVDSAYLAGTAHACLNETDAMKTWAERVARLRGDPESWRSIMQEFRGQIG